MGMYNLVICHYTLPVHGANRHTYQTKSIEPNTLDTYEIREDGSLWHEVYDLEDQSDPKKKGLQRYEGMDTRINQHWIPSSFTGVMHLYAAVEVRPFKKQGWIEFDAQFLNGQLQHLYLIKYEKPYVTKQSPKRGRR